MNGVVVSHSIAPNASDHQRDIANVSVCCNRGDCLIGVVRTEFRPNVLIPNAREGFTVSICSFLFQSTTSSSW